MRTKEQRRLENMRYHSSPKGIEATQRAQRKYIKKNREYATQRYHRYTTEELDMFELIEAGEYTITQVAEMLNRSVNGIVEKLHKIRREKKNADRD